MRTAKPSSMVGRKRVCNAAAPLTGALLCSVLAAPALADGTETLGPPSIPIADGTGLVAAGTGLVNQPGTLSLSMVPEGATIQQVLLYWEGVGTGSTRDPATANPVTDDTINVNGLDITGVLIGGPTILNPAVPNFTTNYRADITQLALDNPGITDLTIQGMDFDWSNSGAGVVVIYDDGSGLTPTQIVDGNDFAFVNSPPTRDTTVPQTFSFDAAPADRVIPLTMFFSNVQGANSGGGQRPTVIEITVNGVVTQVVNQLSSSDGEEWDTLVIDVDVPAGADSITVQALSQDISNSGLIPASFSWTFAGLSVQPFVSQDGAIGDRVWKDLNRNGVQDDGEPGVQDFTVRLLDESGTVLQTTTTGTAGDYVFENLDVSLVYQVEFVNDPAMNMPFTLAGAGDPTDDSDAGPDGRSGLIMLSNEDPTDFTIDAGVINPLAGLGDFVFKDLDGNGQQDGGEPGVDGVVVNLLDGSGAPTGLSTTTADGGLYQFDNLEAGDYIVEFVNDPNMGMLFTQPNEGDDATDSDADPATGRSGVVTLAPGDFNGTIDAGLINKRDLPVCKLVRYGSWKGYVFLKFKDRDSILDYIKGREVIGAPAIYTTGYQHPNSAGPGSDDNIRNGFRYNDHVKKAYMSPRQRFYAVRDRHTGKKWYFMKTLVKNVSWLYIGDENHAEKCEVIQYSPIAFDLNGNGKVDRSGNGVSFDFAGNGEGVNTAEWFAPGEGILLDASAAEARTGEVTGVHLFGNEGGRYADGYAKLALRDRNADGELSGAELSGLAVWVDNGNARLEAGEVHSLATYGIVGIPVTHSNMLASARLSNGSLMAMEDVWFAPAAAPAVARPLAMTPWLVVLFGGVLMGLGLLGRRRALAA